MLFNPVRDDRCDTESMRAGHGNVSPYAAPARATDLSDLAAAYVMTCEHDPLRDGALLYAMRMMQAGVPVELHNYPGTVHGFDLLAPAAAVAMRALDECVAAFRRATGQ